MYNGTKIKFLCRCFWSQKIRQEMASLEIKQEEIVTKPKTIKEPRPTWKSFIMTSKTADNIIGRDIPGVGVKTQEYTQEKKYLVIRDSLKDLKLKRNVVTKINPPK